MIRKPLQKITRKNLTRALLVALGFFCKLSVQASTLWHCPNHSAGVVPILDINSFNNIDRIPSQLTTTYIPRVSCYTENTGSCTGSNVFSISFDVINDRTVQLAGYAYPEIEYVHRQRLIFKPVTDWFEQEKKVIYVRPIQANVFDNLLIRPVRNSAAKPQARPVKWARKLTTDQDQIEHLQKKSQASRAKNSHSTIYIS